MRRLIFATFLLAAFPSVASAGCLIPNSWLQSCQDDEGNTYIVSRGLNSTTVQGTNAQTGSNWSQQSTTWGNTTTTNGIAANGNAWTETEQSSNGMTTYNGVDSNGQVFSYSCTQYGCSGSR